MKALYEFYVNCGRDGELTGLFIADTETVKGCIGRTVSFGEVLGKHSEVEFDLAEYMLKLITANAEDIAHMERIFKGTVQVGYNPIQCIQERDYIEKEI